MEADLAVVKDARTIQQLASQRKEMNLYDRELFLGMSSRLKWGWLDGTNIPDTYRLWGPGEPNGDGKCGSFSSWKGYGWRWNDENCIKRFGFICEQTLGGVM